MAGNTAVTVIGLGEMGAALAGAFLKAGHSTTVWNRTASKADPLVEQGAERAATAAEAAQASPVVIVCLLDYDSVHQVLDPLGDALKGRTVYNLTNGTPEQARETAKWAADLGYDYIDGGIMAVPQIVGTDHAYVLYSGSNTESFERDKPVLSAMGDARFAGTDAGLASLLDLSLLAGMYGMLGGAMQAIAMVRSEGVNAQQFSTELLIPYVTSIAGVVANLARQIDNDEYHVGISAALSMQQVGFRNIVEASRSQGVSSELLDPIQSLMDRRVADGFGNDDFSGVIELLKQNKK
ncbi:NAD(P)-dependent oxidoreductase [Streptomyces griseoloalbus]|uniref:3-hydroxyisobutyrate dehydrogenase-like beta-hydroxyacid dehydrogenase n=1 Tax=Streptomyces griseoloalbus TaxID=67303 RepID=A0A7W8BTE3_9ACTN|nr:NAD(P)-binding domain-containing protein [Streptomyces albaduncus]MBB5129292.1 3-hydroxyisobutyrate dehydrogenase-like beta-hydroxyacid dehydrogenase [Streptomyces albaduncus]GGW64963.1 6-phosphogluconate dehydrogenase [Streptomyces albaduncus]